MTSRCLVGFAVATLLTHAAYAGDFYFPDDPQPVPNTYMLESLPALPDAPAGGMIFLRLDIAKNGAQSLVIKGRRLPAGDYEVFRADVPVGSFTVDESGSGELVPLLPPLDTFFDWFASPYPVSVRQGETALFAGWLIGPYGNLLLDDHVDCTNGARLVAVGEDLDAGGRVVYHSGLGWQRASVVVERLDPGEYVLEADGKPALLFDVDDSGKVKLLLNVPLTSGHGLLPFEVPGKRVRVLSQGQPVLEAQMPFDLEELKSQSPGKQKCKDLGEGAADGLRIDFVKAGYTGADLQAGTLTWLQDPAGQVLLKVLIKGQDFSPHVSYQLFVDDEFLSSVMLGGTAFFEATIPIDPEANPLADLRARRIEVRHNGSAGLALIFPRSVPAGVRSYHADVRKPNLLKLDLLNPGNDMDATGRVQWKASSGGGQLRIHVSDLPAGTYDLRIGGLVVASECLVIIEAGGTADATFSSTGDPALALPLDFKVAGELEVVPAGLLEPVYLQQDL